MAIGKRSVIVSVEPDRSGPGIDQYRDKIVRYLQKRVPSGVVEDLAQETLLTVHAYLNAGNTLENPLAYLYKTANFVVGKNYRIQNATRMTDTVADIDAPGLDSEASSVERDVVSELEFEAFCVAIAKLPDRCRKAFVLKKVYQYSDREIAEHSGVSVRTVNNYVKKGFELVRMYQEEGQGLESR